MTTAIRESYSTKYFVMYKDSTHPMYYYCDAVRRGMDAAEAIIDEPTHGFCKALIRALKMGPRGPTDFDAQLENLTHHDVLHFAGFGTLNDAKIEMVIKKNEGASNEDCYAYVLRDSSFSKEGGPRALFLNETAISTFVSRLSHPAADALKQTLLQNLVTEPECDEPHSKKRRTAQKSQATRLQNKLNGLLATHGDKVEERVEQDMICFIAVKILHEFSHLFNYGTPACRALFVTRNNEKVSPAKKLLPNDTRMFLDLGNLVELVFFGGILHIEEYTPISTELSCRKGSTIHHNSLIFFFTEVVSGLQGKFVPHDLSLAISEGTFDGNISPYQDEINGSEDIYCVVPRFNVRAFDVGYGSSSSKSPSSSTGIISGANKFREFEEKSETPDAKAYFKQQADWYDSLTNEEKLLYHHKRFSF